MTSAPSVAAVVAADMAAAQNERVFLEASQQIASRMQELAAKSSDVDAVTRALRLLCSYGHQYIYITAATSDTSPTWTR